ncbi:hypothetical protein M9434_001819 [Picochlorum sp. BPE23]|nr:hypothetical protein M9434_001819 [Picochlorum sp. BPE23]
MAGYRGRATVMVIVRFIPEPNDDDARSNSTRAQFLALNGQSGHPVEQHPCFLLLSLYMASLFVSSISAFIMMAEQLTKMSLGAKSCVLSALLPSVMDSIII